MVRGDIHLRQLTSALKEALMRCAQDPDVDAVHDTRTGTRRIEAALEAVLQAGAQGGTGDDPRVEAARAWERLLKRVRKAAAPVRDLDVQRKLLKKLAPATAAGAAGGARTALAEQAAKLGGALEGEREKRAGPVKKNAVKWAERLDGHLAAFAAAAAQRRVRGGRKPDAAGTALDAFVRLATRMHQLDAGNLHDFRKGAKKARYMAEAGAGDAHARAVGKALKKLQDEIGNWHDWLMLAEEAHKYLEEDGGEDGAGLTAEIERRRDERFAAAMKVSARMRGRLMGEWLGTRRSGRGIA